MSETGSLATNSNSEDLDDVNSQTIYSVQDFIDIIRDTSVDVEIDTTRLLQRTELDLVATIQGDSSYSFGGYDISDDYLHYGFSRDREHIWKDNETVGLEFKPQINWGMKDFLKEIQDNIDRGEGVPDDTINSDSSIIINAVFEAETATGNGEIFRTEGVDEYNYDIRLELSQDFIEDVLAIDFDQSSNYNDYDENFIKVAFNDNIKLSNYQTNNGNTFDIEQFNDDLDLRAEFRGNLKDRIYQIDQDNGFIEGEIYDYGNGNGNNLFLDIEQGHSEYLQESDTTIFEYSLNEYDINKIIGRSNDSGYLDIELDYIDLYTGTAIHPDQWWSQSLDYNNDIRLNTEGLINNNDNEIKTYEALPQSIIYDLDTFYSDGFIKQQETDNTSNSSINLDYELVSTMGAVPNGNFNVRYEDNRGETYIDINLNGDRGYEEFVGQVRSVNWSGEVDGEHQHRSWTYNHEYGEFEYMNGMNYEGDTSESRDINTYLQNSQNIEQLHFDIPMDSLNNVYYEINVNEDEEYEDAVLCLEYELSAIDAVKFDEGVLFKSDALEQLAVLGDSVDWSKKFVLDITAESYLTDYNIESTDITIDFDPNLFGTIAQEHIMIGGSLPIGNAVEIDNVNGSIRIAAASLSDLNTTTQNTGFVISDATPLVSIVLDFDEDQVKTLSKNSDGSLTVNPLSFDISANQQETIFSRSFTESATGLTNREIVTLDDLGGEIDVYGTDVTLYEAKINLEEQGDGLVLGTQRIIGADKSFTNLVRANDTLTTSAEWLNVGNIEANNLTYTSITNENAELVYASFSQNTVGSGSFENGYFVKDARESTTLTADIKIANNAGKVLDLADGIVSVKATGSDIFTNGLSGQGSSNLITYQGDLNYDGRVSMKDLAYLNAGAARQDLVNETDENGITTEVASDASYARDVDADFNGKIDLADLSVLDQDWGKSLHTSDQGFTGSDDVSWNELDNQGQTSWDNDSFKDQNSIEADNDYEGSLESPSSNGVIGADGNENANDGGLEANSVFQDQFSLAV
jgi:hypothetical protein